MIEFPYLGANGWVPRGRHLTCFVLFEEAPPEKSRARTITGLPRYLRERLEWRGRLLAFGCTDVADKVRKHFGAKKSFELSATDVAFFRGEDFDPKVLPAVREAMRDFGDAEPWVRFYASIHAWLKKVHQKRAIALFVRPVLPGPEEPGPRERQGLDALYDRAHGIAALSGDESPKDIARTFMQKLALFAVTDLDNAARFSPCLAFSFGIDAYSDASVALLGALSDEERAAFFEGLPPKKRLVLLLRTDVLPSLLTLGGHGARLASAFGDFRASEPSAEDIDDLGFRIQGAIAPCAKADRDALYTILTEIESHAAVYGPARGRLAGLPTYLRNGGDAPAADRLEAALAAIG